LCLFENDPKLKAYLCEVVTFLNLFTMKLLLEVKEEKLEFLLELLRHLPFVKAQPLSPQKAELLEDLRSAVEYVNLAKQGKFKPKPLQQLLISISQSLSCITFYL